ncbi:MAG: NAD-dependent protein deacetylase [Gammaproteobacteria bacterium]|jgi:NAD-dependent SIR2 family protein deacetylase|nr:MAG: NAD-dependent protein deacetylase [Gammaproteobacteria bacterium]
MPDLAGLAAYLAGIERLFVLTGAGISAPSGIGTYRNHEGDWQRSDPVQHQDFLKQANARRRYWARSMRGWPSFRDAGPNPAHHALVRLERAGRVQTVVTQNVDGLHQRAGQIRLVELHGNLGEVLCLDCGRRQPRDQLQAWLEQHNGAWLEGEVSAQPDGDAAFEDVRQFDDFREPLCKCGGILKPDVVFYGDSVPKARVRAVRDELDRADGFLVVGSSLMVYSSYRFAKEAKALGLPMAAVNQGRTRADDWLECKWRADSASALPDLVEELCA